jgi:hypothetical protein
VRAAAESSRTRASMGSGGHVTLPARRWMCVAELFGMVAGFHGVAAGGSPTVAGLAPVSTGTDTSIT